MTKTIIEKIEKAGGKIYDGKDFAFRPQTILDVNAYLLVEENSISREKLEKCVAPDIEVTNEILQHLLLDDTCVDDTCVDENEDTKGMHPAEALFLNAGKKPSIETVAYYILRKKMKNQ